MIGCNLLQGLHVCARTPEVVLLQSCFGLSDELDHFGGVVRRTRHRHASRGGGRFIARVKEFERNSHYAEYHDDARADEEGTAFGAGVFGQSRLSGAGRHCHAGRF
jgi:hypothetical protein